MPEHTKHPATYFQAIATRNAAYRQVMTDEEETAIRLLGARQRQVYNALVQRWLQGATNDELALLTNLPANVVTPRTYELRGEGKDNDLARTPLVVPLRTEGRTGEPVKRPTRTGSQAQVWVAKIALDTPTSDAVRRADARPPRIRIRRTTAAAPTAHTLHRTNVR